VALSEAGEGEVGGKDDMKNEGFAEIAVAVFVIASLLGFGYWLESYRCNAQWGDSGLGVKYRIFSGCMLKRGNGTWIPAKSYREMGE